MLGRGLFDNHDAEDEEEEEYGEGNDGGLTKEEAIEFAIAQRELDELFNSQDLSILPRESTLAHGRPVTPPSTPTSPPPPAPVATSCTTCSSTNTGG
jgi:hypothetical protein